MRDEEFDNFYTFSFGLLLSFVLFAGDFFMFRFHLKLVKFNSTTLEMKSGDFQTVAPPTKSNNVEMKATEAEKPKDDNGVSETEPLMKENNSSNADSESTKSPSNLKVAVYDLGALKYNMRVVLGAENFGDMINPFGDRQLGDGEEYEMRMMDPTKITKPSVRSCNSKKCGHDHGKPAAKRISTPEFEDDEYDDDMV